MRGYDERCPKQYDGGDFCAAFDGAVFSVVFDVAAEEAVVFQPVVHAI
jgi:hypothetical protein